jgi:hypothetical protein
MQSSVSENERPTELVILPSKTANDPSNEEGPKIRDGIFFEEGSPNRRKKCGCKCGGERPTNSGIIPSNTVNDSFKEEMPKKRDGSLFEKGSPTRMESSASENERPTELVILPSKTANDPSNEEGPKIRDGSFSEKGSPNRRKKCGCKCGGQRPTNSGIIPSNTVNDPFKEEMPKKRDGSLFEKGSPTRMQSSASENERPTETPHTVWCDWTLICPYPKDVCPFSTVFDPSSRLFSFSWLGCPCCKSSKEERRNGHTDERT